MIDTNLFVLIIIFILGLVLGSFINVVVYRMRMHQDFVKGRSKCPKCGELIKPFDLIPVVSFLFLRGRCRSCKNKISWQYPLVELSSALILGSLYLNLSLIKENIPSFYPVNNIYLLIFFGFIFLSLLTIFVYDLLFYLIPDEVLIPAFLISIFFMLFIHFMGAEGSIINHAFGMILFSGFFAIQYFISRGQWVGFGDIKLGLLLGLLLGWQLSIVALMLAYLGGSIISIVLILLKKKTRKDIIPFGPFLIASSFFAFFYGGIVISWYLGLVLR